MSRKSVRILLALAACWVAGCSDKRVEVSGKVTYNGVPLNKPGGQIIFVGEKGEQAKADIGPDGAYLASGVPTGPNRVVVYYANPAAKGGKPFPNKGQPPSTTPAPAPFLTPARYATAESSDLSVQVEVGTVYNVDMTGPTTP